jgi:ankyrin repeat protein
MSCRTNRLLLLGFLSLAPAIPCRADEIHELVVKGDVAAVRALLDQHPELISAKGFHDGTPLNFAVLAAGNQAKMVSLLLSRGADVNAQDSEGESALWDAARRGNLEVVKLLVRKHVQVNIRTKDGDTPLYAAVSRGNTDVVKYLLSHGAEVDTYDEDGLTPMSSAIIYGDAAIVQMLIANHANVTAPLPNGRGLLDLAVDQEWMSRTQQPEKNDQYRRIVEMLKKAGAVE